MMQLTEIEKIVLKIIKEKKKLTASQIVNIFNESHDLGIDYSITDDELYFVLNKLLKQKLVKGLHEVSSKVNSVIYFPY